MGTEQAPAGSSQFERAAVEVLAEHYTEEAGQDGRGAGDDVTVEAILKAGGVQLLLCTSGRLSQSLNASIRDLAVRLKRGCSRATVICSTGPGGHDAPRI